MQNPGFMRHGCRAACALCAVPAAATPRRRGAPWPHPDSPEPAELSGGGGGQGAPRAGALNSGRGWVTYGGGGTPTEGPPLQQAQVMPPMCCFCAGPCALFCVYVFLCGGAATSCPCPCAVSRRCKYEQEMSHTVLLAKSPHTLRMSVKKHGSGVRSVHEELERTEGRRSGCPQQQRWSADCPAASRGLGSAMENVTDAAFWIGAGSLTLGYVAGSPDWSGQAPRVSLSAVGCMCVMPVICTYMTTEQHK